MNSLWTLARKDLLLLWRDRMSLFWMLGFPLVFAALFGSIFGGSGPSKSNPMQVAVVLDDGGSAGDQGEAADARRAFVKRLDASDAIDVEEMNRSQAFDAVRKGRKAAFLDIKSMPSGGFAMFRGETPQIEIGMDPSRRAEQGMLQGLVMEAAFGGIRELFADPARGRAEARAMIDAANRTEGMGTAQRLILTTFLGALDTFFADLPKLDADGTAPLEPRITTVAVSRDRTGPPNAYSVSFPQSILWAVMGAAAGFAITLVRERRDGTLVRLLTAPITRAAVLGGKLLACFLTGCAIVAILVSIGVAVFDVEVGSVTMLLLATACAAACFAGISMLLSALAKTEQAVGGLSWGVLIVLSMFGGGMVPQIVMPRWMLDVGVVSPARWTIEALEGAIWRGYSVGEMALPCAVLLGIGALTFGLGARRLARQTL